MGKLRLKRKPKKSRDQVLAAVSARVKAFLESTPEEEGEAVKIRACESMPADMQAFVKDPKNIGPASMLIALHIARVMEWKIEGLRWDGLNAVLEG